MLRDTGKWPDSWYVPPLGDQVLKEHHGQLAELLGSLCTGWGGSLVACAQEGVLTDWLLDLA